jgi:hypothetical protein
LAVARFAASAALVVELVRYLAALRVEVWWLRACFGLRARWWLPGASELAAQNLVSVDSARALLELGALLRSRAGLLRPDALRARLELGRGR